MESLRDNALPRLHSLIDVNLYDTADSFGIQTAIHGRKNKGWVGQTLEKYLGLQTRNIQAMDGNDYELKSTTLLKGNDGWAPKETIKITQLGPKKILAETFESSALWTKFSRLVFVGVYHEAETICRIVKVASIDVTAPELIDEIRTFWNDVQNLVARGELKDYVNFGDSSGLVQLRPTGNGKSFSTCPITGDKFPARAFYATKRLIRSIISND